MIGGIIGGVIGLLVIIVIIWCISTSNWFKRAVESVHESESGIDVALTKRYDVLTKELAIVKGYAKHESETLLNVVAARQPKKDAPIDEKAASANAMTDVISKLNVVVEQYPELKANTNFLNLQNQVAEVEEQLQAARRVYNNNVKIFNQKKVSWPSSIFGKKYEKFAFFEAEAAKREDVKMEF